MNKRILISVQFILFFSAVALSQQLRISIATDLGLQRSFKKEQRYWAVGQTVHGQFHITNKDGAYLLISYYSDGKFKNNLLATAKSTLTNPQQVGYVNSAKMRFKQISLGWKHYMKGDCAITEGWSLYGYAGLGLIIGRVENGHSVLIDTSLYNVPVRRGKGNFKRLTLDIGLGWELPIGGSVYFYNEARVWIPTTDYPSPYIFVNQDAPLVGNLIFGLRIFFD